MQKKIMTQNNNIIYYDDEEEGNDDEKEGNDDEEDNNHTLPETNSNFAPENRPSQKENCIPTIHFQVRYVSFPRSAVTARPPWNRGPVGDWH